MLKTIKVELLVKDLVSVDKNNTVDKVGSNSKISGVKSMAKKDLKSAKLKNLIVMEPNFGVGFLTPKARLAFTKLRQIFIEASIFNYFYLEYHIQIKSIISDYAISGILIQLTLYNFS